MFSSRILSVLFVVVAQCAAFHFGTKYAGARSETKLYGENLIIKKNTAKYEGPALGGVTNKNVYDSLVELGNFQTLVTAINIAGLQGKVANKLTTFFAPTDEAFNKLPSGNMEALFSDPDSLAELLTFHVHPGRFNCTRNARTFNTALKNEDGYPKQLSVKVASWTEEVFIMTGQPNHAKVTTRGIQCTNGLIHVLNEVLIPYEGNAPPQVTFMGARDLKGEATLQLGYYGSIAGTDRHGKKYTGPKREYEPVKIGDAWTIAGNWFQDAPKNAPGMSYTELEEW